MRSPESLSSGSTDRGTCNLGIFCLFGFCFLMKVFPSKQQQQRRQFSRIIMELWYVERNLPAE